MLSTLLAASLPTAAPSSVAAMRWEKRVLLVSASDDSDARLQEQRRILSRWKAGAKDRDLVVVEIVADRVTGTSDAAAALRRRYDLPAAAFGVALVGKDGAVKLNDARPISAVALEATIDAMPMRRGGGR